MRFSAGEIARLHAALFFFSIRAHPRSSAVDLISPCLRGENSVSRAESAFMRGDAPFHFGTILSRYSKPSFYLLLRIPTSNHNSGEPLSGSGRHIIFYKGENCGKKETGVPAAADHVVNRILPHGPDHRAHLPDSCAAR